MPDAAPKPLNNAEAADYLGIARSTWTTTRSRARWCWQARSYTTTCLKRCTPAAGEFPIVEVAFNGQVIGIEGLGLKVG